MFESKLTKVPMNTRSSLDKSKAFTSPDKRVQSTSVQDFYNKAKLLRGTSTSPRYRSPTHSRLNLKSVEAIICPTCEKRGNESSCHTFHDSPPKVRPSHHNVVCEDCSQGSYSRVLKVVCLNGGEEALDGTKKIKIIESAADINESNTFVVLGNGKNLQVHYQEVYPPPKPELTSLQPEFRPDSLYRYYLKEEERKRVAIRRAEYANRVKGVSKTIVTTIPPTDKIQRTDESLEKLQQSNYETYNTASFEPENRPKKVKSPASYYRKPQDSLKESIEITKQSVKHKILAKLAGKEFPEYRIDDQSDIENRDSIKYEGSAIFIEENIEEYKAPSQSYSMPNPKSKPNNKSKSDGLVLEKDSAPSVFSKKIDEFNKPDIFDHKNQEKTFEYIVQVEEPNKILSPQPDLSDKLNTLETTDKIQPASHLAALETTEKIESIDLNTIAQPNSPNTPKIIENLNKDSPLNTLEPIPFKKIESPGLEDNFQSTEKKLNLDSLENSQTIRVIDSLDPLQDTGRFVITEQYQDSELLIESKDPDPLASAEKYSKIGKQYTFGTEKESNTSNTDLKNALGTENPPELLSPSKTHLQDEVKSEKALNSPLSSLKTSPKTRLEDEKVSDSPQSSSKVSIDIKHSEALFQDSQTSHSSTKATKNLEEKCLIDGASNNSFEKTTKNSSDSPTHRHQSSFEHTVEIQPKPKEKKYVKSDFIEKKENIDKILQKISEYDDAQEGPTSFELNLDINKDLDEKNEEAFCKTCNREFKDDQSTQKIDLDKLNLLFGILTDTKVIKGLKLLGGFADYLEINGKDILGWKL
jgi:hypothetical protein